jgi:ubiquinone/menaquinone biosynthesis C-methylase UbiE
MVKELEDYDWFPRLLRRFQVDFIGTIVKWFAVYQPLTVVLKQLLQQNNLRQITDCCSGSGAPAMYMQQQLKGAAQTVLTDKFPQQLYQSTEGIVYKNESFDVLQLQPDAQQLYTMYNSFHHFSTTEQEKILQQFAGKRTAFIIAEILQPNVFTLFKIVFTTTIGQLLLTPFIKPFSLVRLFFTYLLPVNIITMTYDGIVSVLKSKSVKQYQQLAERISITAYTVTVNNLKSSTASLIYITGTPLQT